MPPEVTEGVEEVLGSGLCNEEEFRGALSTMVVCESFAVFAALALVSPRCLNFEDLDFWKNPIFAQNSGYHHRSLQLACESLGNNVGRGDVVPMIANLAR